MKNLSYKLRHGVVDENERIEIASVANIPKTCRLILLTYALIYSLDRLIITIMRAFLLHTSLNGSL